MQTSVISYWVGTLWIAANKEALIDLSKKHMAEAIERTAGGFQGVKLRTRKGTPKLKKLPVNKLHVRNVIAKKRKLALEESEELSDNDSYEPTDVDDEDEDDDIEDEENIDDAVEEIPVPPLKKKKAKGGIKKSSAVRNLKKAFEGADGVDLDLSDMPELTGKQRKLFRCILGEKWEVRIDPEWNANLESIWKWTDRTFEWKNGSTLIVSFIPKLITALKSAADYMGY